VSVDAPSVSSRRLISRRLRGAAVCTAAICAAITALLGARYAGVSSAGRFDNAIDPRLTSRLGEHHRLIGAVFGIGGPLSVTVLTALFVVTLLVLRRPRFALLAALAPPVASAITEWVIKPLVERDRGGSWSYPSGHTTGIFAVALVVVLLVFGQTPRLPVAARLVVSAGPLAVATGVALASIAAGHHYATDTVGGACVALATVLILSLFVDAAADARASR
jgi:membrane-associated phospholipid phosphatase